MIKAQLLATYPSSSFYRVPRVCTFSKACLKTREKRKRRGSEKGTKRCAGEEGGGDEEAEGCVAWEGLATTFALSVVLWCGAGVCLEVL